MKKIFETDATWRILSYFLEHPAKESYPRELERSLSASSGTTSTICRELEKEGILKSAEKARSRLYKLEDNFFVRSLKRAFFLEKIRRYRVVFENAEFQAVALYGSYASGEYHEKSDVDVVVITNVERGRVREIFQELQKASDAELSLSVLTLAQWKSMAERQDRFYKEVIANHVLLYGTPILMG